MDFLQSEEWRKFQAAVGRRTFLISETGFHASIIEHSLPVVGNYFYVPRGPEIRIMNYESGIKNELGKLIDLAEKGKAGWIRFDPMSDEIIKLVAGLIPGMKIKKAPHDMQPREVFVIDITKPEEELLKEMKEKTRYNIRLAERKGVRVISITNNQETISKYLGEFLRLIKLTSERQGITSHPESYYRRMFEVIPPEAMKLYVAEYGGNVIAANIVVLHNDAATYLHGASDNEYRNLMAPYFLQWRAIQDAQKNGCARYDFGGVKTGEGGKSWAGITKFKTGFSPNTQATKFPGSYDIVIKPSKYNLYMFLQAIKSFL